MQTILFCPDCKLLRIQDLNPKKVLKNLPNWEATTNNFKCKPLGFNSKTEKHWQFVRHRSTNIGNIQFKSNTSHLNQKILFLGLIVYWDLHTHDNRTANIKSRQNKINRQFSRPYSAVYDRDNRRSRVQFSGNRITKYNVNGKKTLTVRQKNNTESTDIAETTKTANLTTLQWFWQQFFELILEKKTKTKEKISNYQ